MIVEIFSVAGIFLRSHFGIVCMKVLGKFGKAKWYAPFADVNTRSVMKGRGITFNVKLDTLLYKLSSS